MISTNVPQAQSEMRRFVEEILMENARYKRELRSFHREVLVSPVVMKLASDPHQELHCVSRNISPAGIALISAFNIEDKASATLQLYRLTGSTTTEILAECRWCRAFGPSYWMSGWKFVHLLGRD